MAEKLEPPQPIAKWDWPNTIPVPDGYDMTRAPDLTRENLQFLADKYNELVTFLWGVSEGDSNAGR